MAKTYKYIGDGVGVAGLPHVVTDVEARALGAEMILEAALWNGTYEEVPEVQKSKGTKAQKAKGADVDLTKENDNG